MKKTRSGLMICSSAPLRPGPCGHVRLADLAAIHLKGLYSETGSSADSDSEAVRRGSYRTWLDLELPDGDLTILEADDSESDPDAAYTA